MNEEIVRYLRERRAGAEATVEALRASRVDVDANQQQLESPRAAFELIDFFDRFFTQAVAELDRLIAAAEQGTAPSADTLRAIAGTSTAEEQRCRRFNDLWVSKPLPYEAQRPLLARIYATARDQLVTFRDLDEAASQLEAPASTEASHYDRRGFFARFTGGLRRE